MKTIIIVKPREGKAPLAWPEQTTMHVEGYYLRMLRSKRRTKFYRVTGFSTLVEYNASTTVPLDRDTIMGLMDQWRQMYGRGMWDFYLKPVGHKPALFDPRRKKMFFIGE